LSPIKLKLRNVAGYMPDHEVAAELNFSLIGGKKIFIMV